MKVAVIKLGSRISFNANDTSGGNGEARSIIKILETAGCEVHIFTKILKKDILLPQYKWHEIKDTKVDEKGYCSVLDQCKALLVINGNVNFFGGAEDPEQILNYHIINYFRGKVFYAYCDPALTLKQLWPAIEKKPWATNWSRYDIEITRDDIVYLSQPYDTDKAWASMGKNCVIPKISPDAHNIVHFPFEKFPCLNEQLPPCHKLEVDLSYGGTMRGGKRIRKMVEFYFNHPEEISVEMFGKIEASDFEEFAQKNPGKILRHPKYTGPVKYADMLPKMNKSLAHIVIGDPFYEEINDMAQRAYESIWSNVVTFIDADLDSHRRVYWKDRELADFLYVKTGKEVAEKIMLLKSDPELRLQILSDQLNAIEFDAKAYADSLIEIMKGKING